MTQAPEYRPLTAALLAQVIDQADEFVQSYARGPAAVRAAMSAPDHWRGVMLWAGRPVLAMGLWPLWPGRAEAWAVPARDIPAKALIIGCRKMRATMDTIQAAEPAARRIEMWVRSSVLWRDSFARALGMRVEGVARAWGPDGSTYTLFARVAERIAA